MINTRQDSQSETTTLFSESQICLLEITDSGTILYCRNNATRPLTAIVGRNLFEDAAPFENTGELRVLLSRFIESDFISQTFTFQCRIKNKVVPAKIMLIRTNNRSGKKKGKTTIVDIRKL